MESALTTTPPSFSAKESASADLPLVVGPAIRIACGCGITVTIIAAKRAREYLIAMKQSVITCNIDVMGGTPVFRGTRVPVQTLLDYLEAGDSIDEFLQGFPTVSRQQVIAFLEEAKDRLVRSAS